MVLLDLSTILTDFEVAIEIHYAYFVSGSDSWLPSLVTEASSYVVLGHLLNGPFNVGQVPHIRSYVQ